MAQTPEPQPTHLYRTFVCTCCGNTFQAPISCGNRFCTICQGPRRRKIRAKLGLLARQMQQEKGYSLKHITLTIPNNRNVQDGAKTLVSSFRRLRQRSLWKNRSLGGAYVIEVTGSPGTWHVHLHILTQSRYILHSKLMKEWSNVSPGRIVWIKNTTINHAVNYLTKYLTKSEVKPEHLVELSSGLANTRLFQVFGSWHALNLRVPKALFQCQKCGQVSWCPMELIERWGHQLHTTGTTWNRKARPPPPTDDQEWSPPEWEKKPLRPKSSTK